MWSYAGKRRCHNTLGECRIEVRICTVALHADLPKPERFPVLYANLEHTDGTMGERRQEGAVLDVVSMGGDLVRLHEARLFESRNCLQRSGYAFCLNCWLVLLSLVLLSLVFLSFQPLLRSQASAPLFHVESARDGGDNHRETDERGSHEAFFVNLAFSYG